MTEIPEYLDTLRLIAARAPHAAHAALGAIEAFRTRRRILGCQHAADAAHLALSDSTIEWTSDERTQVASLLGIYTAPTRSVAVQFRLSVDEKQQVEADAKAAGLNQSSYIRRCLGLPVHDMDG